MLYYGTDKTMDFLNFDINKAKENLIVKNSKSFKFWIDENDGKNDWMSSLLCNTYMLVSDAYEDEEDLNVKILKAGEEHIELQGDFIDAAIAAGLLYDNLTAETWKDGDVNNKIIDEKLLKAKNKLKALDDQKQNLYKRMDFVREATSIYLKHEWDRAKKGK